MKNDRIKCKICGCVPGYQYNNKAFVEDCECGAFHTLVIECTNNGKRITEEWNKQNEDRAIIQQSLQPDNDVNEKGFVDTK